jgi:hypothetical protein
MIKKDVLYALGVGFHDHLVHQTSMPDVFLSGFEIPTLMMVTLVIGQMARQGTLLVAVPNVEVDALARHQWLDDVM